MENANNCINFNIKFNIQIFIVMIKAAKRKTSTKFKFSSLIQSGEGKKFVYSI